MTPYSPRLPWILVGRHPQGGFVVQDSRSGEQAYAPDEHAVAQFAAQHSASQGYGGLGDVVAGAAQRLGFEGCTPCAKRQAALNGLFPRVFRR
jgi:hypothetical protein